MNSWPDGQACEARGFLGSDGNGKGVSCGRVARDSFLGLGSRNRSGVGLLLHYRGFIHTRELSLRREGDREIFRRRYPQKRVPPPFL